MLKTGYEELDKVIGGLENGKLYTLASRPGVGKSTLALNIINNAFKQSKDKILYFNLETPKDLLNERITSDNIEIIDTPRTTIEEIKNKCESTTDLSLIVVDYAQLIYTSSFNGSRLEEREYITQIFKSLVADLNVPILVLSQLSRDMTNYENQDFSHLKLTESISLLQDSDRTIFLYRDSYLNKNNKSSLNKDYRMKIVNTVKNIVVVVIP